MKKSLITLIATSLFLICGVSHAQQLENSSFENWSSVNDTQEPNNWNTIMTGDLCRFCSFIASQRVFADNTEAVDGEKSIRIESKSILGDVIFNGSVTTGQIVVPSASASAGYNQTKTENADFNQKVNAVPDSLVFWAKYNVVDRSDSALVAFVLHGDTELKVPTPNTQQSSIAATIRQTFQTNGKWQRISYPFIRTNSYSSPKYILATFSSSFAAGKGNGSATLWIDKVELVYNQDQLTLDSD